MQTIIGDTPVRFIKNKRQKNLRIRIKHHEVLVSGPRFCSEKQLRTFLAERMDWVQKNLDKLQAQRSITEQKLDGLNGGMLLRGEVVPVKIHHNLPDTSAWKIKERNGRVDVYPPGENADTVPGEVLVSFLKRIAKTEIPARFEQVAAELPFEWNKVFIRSQKTKWGTCSSKGHLSFNWRLVKCPHWIWDYIFIHELCHTVHFNHSKEYWNLVEAHFPGVKEANKWIREHGPVIFSDEYRAASGSEDDTFSYL